MIDQQIDIRIATRPSSEIAALWVPCYETERT
jgi:hypothetical protein